MLTQESQSQRVEVIKIPSLGKVGRALLEHIRKYPDVVIRAELHTKKSEV